MLEITDYCHVKNNNNTDFLSVAKDRKAENGFDIAATTWYGGGGGVMYLFKKIYIAVCAENVFGN